MRWGLLAAGLGAGASALLLWSRRALATEDDTGQTLPPEGARREIERVATLRRVEPDVARSLSATAAEVLLRLVGTKEDPPKSNRGPVVDQINRGVHGDGEKLLGKPWCARAVRYSFEKAAQELKIPPPFAGVKGTLAAVLDWPKVFKGYETAPKPGAVGLLIKTGIPGVDKGKRHATLVVRVEGPMVVTAEGNHKDSVAVVTRPRSDFVVFLDVERYAAERGRQKAPAVSGGGMIGLDLLGVESA